MPVFVPRKEWLSDLEESAKRRLDQTVSGVQQAGQAIVQQGQDTVQAAADAAQAKKEEFAQSLLQEQFDRLRQQAEEAMRNFRPQPPEPPAPEAPEAETPTPTPTPTATPTPATALPPPATPVTRNPEPPVSQVGPVIERGQPTPESGIIPPPEEEQPQQPAPPPTFLPPAQPVITPPPEPQAQADTGPVIERQSMPLPSLPQFKVPGSLDEIKRGIGDTFSDIGTQARAKLDEGVQAAGLGNVQVGGSFDPAAGKLETQPDDNLLHRAAASQINQTAESLGRVFDPEERLRKGAEIGETVGDLMAQQPRPGGRRLRATPEAEARLKRNLPGVLETVGDVGNLIPSGAEQAENFAGTAVMEALRDVPIPEELKMAASVIAGTGLPTKAAEHFVVPGAKKAGGAVADVARSLGANEMGILGSDAASIPHDPNYVYRGVTDEELRDLSAKGNLPGFSQVRNEPTMASGDVGYDVAGVRTGDRTAVVRIHRDDLPHGSTLDQEGTSYTRGDLPTTAIQVRGDDGQWHPAQGFTDRWDYGIPSKEMGARPDDDYPLRASDLPQEPIPPGGRPDDDFSDLQRQYEDWEAGSGTPPPGPGPTPEQRAKWPQERRSVAGDLGLDVSHLSDDDLTRMSAGEWFREIERLQEGMPPKPPRGPMDPDTPASEIPEIWREYGYHVPPKNPDAAASGAAWLQREVGNAQSEGADAATARRWAARRAGLDDGLNDIPDNDLDMLSPEDFHAEVERRLGRPIDPGGEAEIDRLLREHGLNADDVGPDQRRRFAKNIREGRAYDDNGPPPETGAQGAVPPPPTPPSSPLDTETDYTIARKQVGKNRRQRLEDYDRNVPDHWTDEDLAGMDPEEYQDWLRGNEPPHPDTDDLGSAGLEPGGPSEPPLPKNWNDDAFLDRGRDRRARAIREGFDAGDLGDVDDAAIGRMSDEDWTAWQDAREQEIAEHFRNGGTADNWSPGGEKLPPDPRRLLDEGKPLRPEDVHPPSPNTTPTWEQLGRSDDIGDVGRRKGMQNIVSGQDNFEEWVALARRAEDRRRYADALGIDVDHLTDRQLGSMSAAEWRKIAAAGGPPADGAVAPVTTRPPASRLDEARDAAMGAMRGVGFDPAKTGREAAFDLGTGTAGAAAGALTADEDATPGERAARALTGFALGAGVGPRARWAKRRISSGALGRGMRDILGDEAALNISGGRGARLRGTPQPDWAAEEAKALAARNADPNKNPSRDFTDVNLYPRSPSSRDVGPTVTGKEFQSLMRRYGDRVDRLKAAADADPTNTLLREVADDAATERNNYADNLRSRLNAHPDAAHENQVQSALENVRRRRKAWEDANAPATPAAPPATTAVNAPPAAPPATTPPATPPTPPAAPPTPPATPATPPPVTPPTPPASPPTPPPPTPPAPPTPASPVRGPGGSPINPPATPPGTGVANPATMEPIGAMEIADSYRYGVGLLLNPVNAALDFGAGRVEAPWKYARDQLLHIKDPNRRSVMLAQGAGERWGATQGMKNAVEIWRTGTDLNELYPGAGAPATNPSVMRKAAAQGRTTLAKSMAGVEAGSRARSAMDAPNHGRIYGAELWRQAADDANANARATGLPDDQPEQPGWWAHIADLVTRANTPNLSATDPAFQMQKNALEMADRAIGRNDMGRIGNALGGVFNHPLLRQFFPIYKTAYNLGVRGLERSPLGYAGMLWDKIDPSRGRNANRAISKERQMDAAMGSAAWFGGMLPMALAGNVTGYGPTDEKTRADLTAQGWKPYAVRIPGTKVYVGYKKLGPISASLALAGAIGDAWTYRKPDANAYDVTTDAASNFGRWFGDQFVLRSAGDLQQMSTNLGVDFPSWAGKLVNQYSTGAGAGFIASAIDPYQRETKSADDPMKAFTNEMAYNVPGLRQNLPIKYDEFGDPLPNPNYGWRTLTGGTVGSFQSELNPEHRDLRRYEGSQSAADDARAAAAIKAYGENFSSDTPLGPETERLADQYLGSDDLDYLGAVADAKAAAKERERERLGVG